MKRLLTLLAVLSLFVGASRVGAATLSAEKCRIKLDKVASWYVAHMATLPFKKGCEPARLAGKIDKCTDCYDNPRVQGWRNRGVAVFLSIAKKCSGASLESIDWDIGQCPNFEGGDCREEIGDTFDVAACEICMLDSIAAKLNRATDGLFRPSGSKQLKKCQKAIGLQTAMLFGAKPEARLKTEQKRLVAIQNACSGFTPSEIGFADNCRDLHLPAGGSCDRQINSLEDIVQCTGCAADFSFQCADALSDAENYPDECNRNPAGPGWICAPSPTPTAILTATPTRTPTPTPTITPTDFPDCMWLLKNCQRGDQASYDSGTHAIVPDEKHSDTWYIEGSDDVYRLHDALEGSFLQCACTKAGKGIKTAWYRSEGDLSGWFPIKDPIWGLGDVRYLTHNSAFTCPQ